MDRNQLPVMGRVQSADAIMKNKSTTMFGNIVALDESPVQEDLIYVGSDDGFKNVTLAVGNILESSTSNNNGLYEILPKPNISSVDFSNSNMVICGQISGQTISSKNTSVDIDTFKDASGTGIPVYWPGGVVPVVTTTAGKTDIYSFKILNGATLSSDGLFGVVTGQNFS